MSILSTIIDGALALLGTGRPVAAPVPSTNEETIIMSDQNQAASQAAATIAAPETDAVLGKLKAILVTLGHDVEGAWDEAVALAKKVA